MTEKRETMAEAPEKKEQAPAEGEKKKSRKGKIIKRIILLVLVLAVLAAAGWIIYSKLRAEYQVTYDPYTATTGSISNSLSFTGSMQLINSETFTAEADGKIREIYVSTGDAVKEGQKLLRLSTGETLEAGFDGTVSSVAVSKGDEVKNGDTLLTVADFDHMKVSVRVGESDVSQVSVGQACKVSISSAVASFDSVIDSIDYVAYTGNNVAYYPTVVKVDTAGSDKQILPGMQATVTITLEEAENVTVLKMDALSTARDNTAFVYKENEKGEMEQVAVTVGVSNGNYVEIKEGVTAGETIYKVAEKEEQATGLAALFSGLFSTPNVNRPGSGMGGGSGSMPDFSNMPDMSNMPSGFPGSSGGSGGGSNYRNGQPGGSRGN